MKFGVLILIMAALPLSVNLVQKNQENRSQAAPKECSNNDNCCTGSPNFGTCIRVADQGIPNKKGQACKTTDGRDGTLVFNKCLDPKWGKKVGSIRCCATKVNPKTATPTLLPVVTQGPSQSGGFPSTNSMCQNKNNNYPGDTTIKPTNWNVDGKDFTVYIFEPKKTLSTKRISKKYDIANINNGSWLMEVPEKYKRPKTTEKYVLGGVCFETNNFGYSPYFVDKRVFPAYSAMVEAMWADGAPISAGTIGCGYRDPKMQDLLYKRYDDSSLAASSCGSSHRTGRAMDLNVEGSFVSKKTGKKITVHQWIVNNAAKYGFRRYTKENWHWEYNP